MTQVSQPRGKFITLEGGEGAGKSTNLQFMASWLREQGIDVLVTREPGGTELGEKIRALLLDTAHSEMTHDCELLLMFAARAQHIEQKIQPALAQGKWVISDRFTDATYAYQGAARGMEPERIAQIEAWVQQGFQPECTFILDLDSATGMQRVCQRGVAHDRFEQEAQTFFNRVRQGYLQRAQAAPERYRVIDASRTLEQVQSALVTELKALL